MNPERRSLLHSDVDSMGPEMHENYNVLAKGHRQFIIRKINLFFGIYFYLVLSSQKK